MTQGSFSRAPSSILNSILVTAINSLNEIDMFTTSVLPMELTDLFSSMKKVQSAFTATAAAGVDFTNTISRDRDFIDLFLAQGATAVFRVPEISATR